MNKMSVRGGRSLTSAIVSRERLRRLSAKSAAFSTFRVAAYFGCLVALWLAMSRAEEWYIIATLTVGIGIVFAHGLELQHEALHGNLFDSKSLNRAIGTLLGAPMLVSFTHYKIQHLHHHRHVGTSNDQELFDYSSQSLMNPIAFSVRAWNLLRIPTFLVTVLKLLQNDFPTLARADARIALRQEYLGMAITFVAAMAITAYYDTTLFVLCWFLPWLLVGELVHFLIEVPEHIGCDRSNRSILRNTRSYRTNFVWGYLSNHNNYHIEHHLYPGIPAYRLKELHADVVNAQGHHVSGYFAALAEVIASVRGDEAPLAMKLETSS